MVFFFSGWIQSMSGFQSHCRSALSVVWRFWCCSVVSSCDGSGVGCFCCRVWRSDVTVGLHWELLQGVCCLLHSVTLLWNVENMWWGPTVLLYWKNRNQDLWGTRCYPTITVNKYMWLNELYNKKGQVVFRQRFCFIYICFLSLYSLLTKCNLAKKRICMKKLPCHFKLNIYSFIFTH